MGPCTKIKEKIINTVKPTIITINSKICSKNMFQTIYSIKILILFCLSLPILNIETDPCTKIIPRRNFSLATSTAFYVCTLFCCQRSKR